MPHIGYFLETGYPKPLIVGCHEFTPKEDTQDFYFGDYYVMNRSALTMQSFYAAVVLPQRAIVTKLTLYGSRTDAAATMSLELRRCAWTGPSQEMAKIIADWTTGNSSGYDNTIEYPLIDNDNYLYRLMAILDPNDAPEDISFQAARIDWS